MSSDTGQATKPTMRAGARSRSSCAHLAAFRLSLFIPRPGITRPATERFFRNAVSFAQALVFVCALALYVAGAHAQTPLPQPPPPPPPGQAQNNGQGSVVKVDVNLVVLHTTVIDDRQRFADGLKEENFRVFEDKVEQKLAVFKREDVPV